MTARHPPDPECPECGSSNTQRASNNLHKAFHLPCGWFEDPDWDGPETLSEWRSQQGTPEPSEPLELEDIKQAIEVLEIDDTRPDMFFHEPRRTPYQMFE